jgi:transposase
MVPVPSEDCGFKSRRPHHFRRPKAPAPTTYGFPSDAICNVVVVSVNDDPREAGTSGGLDQRGRDSMAVPNVACRSAAAELMGILDSPDIQKLIGELEETRWTGRPGYPIRTMVGMALAKSLYAIPCWTRVVALVREHYVLQSSLGCEGEPPSEWACYRFARKLREHDHLLDACIAGVLDRLRSENPTMGGNIAIDGSDLPAYANGQRFVSKNGRERAPEEYSDPDASWGHRSAVSTRKGGGFYGYKLHAAVDTATGLPVAWTVQSARHAEANFALPLIDAARVRGFKVETAAMDKGYDNGPIYDGCEDRGVRPIISLRQTPGVVRGDHKPPVCEHGKWTFAGADYSRKATKWRCPTGECSPASKWIKADRLHPLIPRETHRWRKLYKNRAAVEREFGALKHRFGLLPLRTRRIDRVKLHADLTILAKLATALAQEQTAALAA